MQLNGCGWICARAAEHALEAAGAVFLWRPSVCERESHAPQLKRDPLGSTSTFLMQTSTSGMSSLLEVKQLVSAFIGAALALVGQWLIRKAAKAWTAKR